MVVLEKKENCGVMHSSRSPLVYEKQILILGRQRQKFLVLERHAKCLSPFSKMIVKRQEPLQLVFCATCRFEHVVATESQV